MSVTIKRPEELELMREAGKILAKVHEQLGNELRPGMSTYEIDRIGEEMIRSFGCEPSFKNYCGYPASVCVSIDEEVVHGIPSKEKFIQEGDIGHRCHPQRIPFRCCKNTCGGRNFKRSSAFDRAHKTELF